MIVDKRQNTSETGRGKTHTLSVPTSTPQQPVPTTSVTTTRPLQSSGAGTTSTFQHTVVPSSGASSIAGSSSNFLASTTRSPLSSSTGTTGSSSNLSDGAVAGVAIGCLVIGAMIAFGISLCFLRRRGSQRPRTGTIQAQQPLPGFMSDKKGPRIVVATSQRTIDNELDSLLPQEADDNTVRKKASTLFDQFELHVENYYRDVKVEIYPATESELSRFSSPHLPEPLVAFLNSTSRPMTLIKHSLAFHIMSLTAASGESTRTLLPQELVGMTRRVNQRNPTADSGLAFSRWKMLTAYLRSDASVGSSTDDPEIKRAVEEAVQGFIRVFAPWSKPGITEAEKNKNLTDIVNNAASFALWLFSQPSTFKYDWKPPVDVRDRSHRSIVTVPAVLKVTDSRGQALSRPLIVVDAVRARV